VNSAILLYLELYLLGYSYRPLMNGPLKVKTVIYTSINGKSPHFTIYYLKYIKIKKHNITGFDVLLFGEEISFKNI